MNLRVILGFLGAIGLLVWLLYFIDYQTDKDIDLPGEIDIEDIFKKKDNEKESKETK